MLNLADNRLTNLDSIDLLKFAKNSMIGLENNRFSCEYLKQFVKQWHELTFIGNVWTQTNNTDVECLAKMENKTNSSIVTTSEDKIKATELRVFIRELEPKPVLIDESSNKITTTEAAKIEFDNPTETEVLPKQTEQHLNCFENKTFIKSYFEHLRHFNISGSQSNDTIEMIQLLGEPLESLDVSVNFVGVIRNSTFLAFINLQYLNLSQTNLSIIESNAFRHLNKLKSLDLSSNYLDNVKFLLTSGSVNVLETLILNGNRLKNLDDTFLIFQRFRNLSRFEFLRQQYSCEYVITYLKGLTKDLRHEMEALTNVQLNILEMMCAFQELLSIIAPGKSEKFALF